MKKGVRVPDMTPEQLEAKRRTDRWQHKMRERGTPVMILPHEYAHARRMLNDFRKAGMTWLQIAGQLGNQNLASGLAKHHDCDYQSMKRPLYEALKRVVVPEFAPDRISPVRGKIPSGRYVPNAIGVQRRLQALRCIGFPSAYMAVELKTSHQAVSYLANGIRKQCFVSTFKEIVALYDKYKDQDPEEHGVTAFGAMRTRQHAARQLWAPPHCWDDSVEPIDDPEHEHRIADIDDPDSFPEWTGECGTVEGYYLHLKHDILVKVWHGKERDKRMVQCVPCLNGKREATSVSMVDVDRAALFKAFDDGMSIRDAAAAFRCSTRTVQRYRAQWQEWDD